MKKILAPVLSGMLMIMGWIISANVFAAGLPPEPSLAPMLQKIMPAVVNVTAQGEIMVPVVIGKNNPNDQGQGDDDGSGGGAMPAMPYGQLREFASLGSGVVIDAARGYIMTNAHVVDRAKIITVTLSDGRNFRARLVGADAATDIAVLQIKADKLSAMPVGDSDKLQVGDFVVAIGNPFGLKQTVTSGIISALGRGNLGIEGPQGLENFIQTDASINPGNSGGALVNMQGQLIGINTAILSPSASEDGGGNVGIGFAIPINMARTVMAQLIEYGSVKRGLIGVILQDVTPDLANALNMSGVTGGLVTQISPNSPAARAGIQAGDIIVSINDQKTTSASAVKNAVGLLRVGAKIEIDLMRNNKPMTVYLTTADPDQYLTQVQQANPLLFGLVLRNFNEQLPLQGMVSGVQVLHVSKDSIAWRAGLIRGDVIVSANQQPVKTLEDLQKAASGNKQRLLLNVLRGGGALFIVLSNSD